MLWVVVRNDLPTYIYTRTPLQTEEVGVVVIYYFHDPISISPLNYFGFCFLSC